MEPPLPPAPIVIETRKVSPRILNSWQYNAMRHDSVRANILRIYRVRENPPPPPDELSLRCRDNDFLRYAVRCNKASLAEIKICM